MDGQNGSPLPTRLRQNGVITAETLVALIPLPEHTEKETVTRIVLAGCLIGQHAVRAVIADQLVPWVLDL